MGEAMFSPFLFTSINFFVLINDILRSSINFFLLLTILLNSCMSLNPITAQSGANSLYETFFVGESGTQYFIKPIELNNHETSGIIKIDFTFRYKNIIKDSVNVNFSLFEYNIFKTVDSLSISNPNNNILTKNIALMYNEKQKRKVISRFSTIFSLQEVIEIFKNNNWKISVYSNNLEQHFNSSNKTKKSLDKINQNIFLMF
jgi:hypothetical protein